VSGFVVKVLVAEGMRCNIDIWKFCIVTYLGDLL
jgi:hypothetical protein